jgi:hypothetical protein
VRRPPWTAEARRRWVERDEAKTGWRFWGVTPDDGAYRLESPFRTNLWLAGTPLVAECLGTDISFGARSRKHDAPAASCRCGVYGGTFRGLRSFLRGTFVPPAEPVVIGRVTLWGAVIDERSAWRAQYAYPDRLLVPTLLRSADRIAADLEAYGVPVDVLDVAQTYVALNPTAAVRALD